MGGTKAEAAATPVRLFVGGLPNGVTAADLTARFTPFGSVAAIEVVAAKPHDPLRPADAVAGGCSRGFAYVELRPKDAVSVHRCLSLYNNSKWRGQVLRVEAAKPDYLARLQQEWRDDAEAEAAAAEEAERREREGDGPIYGGRAQRPADAGLGGQAAAGLAPSRVAPKPKPGDVAGSSAGTPPAGGGATAAEEEGLPERPADLHLHNPRNKHKPIRVVLHEPRYPPKLVFPPAQPRPLQRLAWEYTHAPASALAHLNEVLAQPMRPYHPEGLQGGSGAAGAGGAAVPLVYPASAEQPPQQPSGGGKLPDAVPRPTGVKRELGHELMSSLKVLKSIDARSRKLTYEAQAAAAVAAAKGRGKGVAAQAAIRAAAFAPADGSGGLPAGVVSFDDGAGGGGGDGAFAAVLAEAMARFDDNDDAGSSEEDAPLPGRGADARRRPTGTAAAVAAAVAGAAGGSGRPAGRQVEARQAGPREHGRGEQVEGDDEQQNPSAMLEPTAVSKPAAKGRGPSAAPPAKRGGAAAPPAQAQPARGPKPPAAPAPPAPVGDGDGRPAKRPRAELPTQAAAAACLPKPDPVLSPFADDSSESGHDDAGAGKDAGDAGSRRPEPAARAAGAGMQGQPTPAAQQQQPQRKRQAAVPPQQSPRGVGAEAGTQPPRAAGPSARAAGPGAGPAAASGVDGKSPSAAAAQRGQPEAAAPGSVPQAQARPRPQPIGEGRIPAAAAAKRLRPADAAPNSVQARPWPQPVSDAAFRVPARPSAGAAAAGLDRFGDDSDESFRDAPDDSGEDGGGGDGPAARRGTASSAAPPGHAKEAWLVGGAGPSGGGGGRSVPATAQRTPLGAGRAGGRGGAGGRGRAPPKSAPRPPGSAAAGSPGVGVGRRPRSARR